MKTTRLVITAGPTSEPIDPVRVLTNRSTGEMGYAIAREAIKRRYKVVLISGPTCLRAPAGIKTIAVETALEMRRALRQELKKCDCLIMAAAVADFRLKKKNTHKIKKGKTLKLEFTRNPDILKEVSRTGNLVKIGFALESNKLLVNAQKKLIDKDLDIVIANRIDKENYPFGKGKKDFIFLKRSEKPVYLRKKTKREISRAILDTLKNSML